MCFAVDVGFILGRVMKRIHLHNEAMKNFLPKGYRKHRWKTLILLEEGTNNNSEGHPETQEACNTQDDQSHGLLPSPE